MTQRQEKELRLGGESFLIRVQYQENATWQGAIQWLDGRKTQTFRSLLEMTMLIREALEQNCSSGLLFRSWEDDREETPPETGGERDSVGDDSEREVLA